MPNAFKQILRRLKSTRPRSRRRFASRQIDCLETRILPTAVVAFTGTAMTITGDTTGNNITVARVGNVVHVDANGGLITVAGSDVPAFDFNLNGAFNLTATFQDGNDTLTIAGGLQLKSVSVKLGEGLVNTFTMVDANLSGKLTVTGNDGPDIITIQTSSIASTTLINTGWNTDVVSIIDSTFIGATTLNTDLGADIVTIIGGATSRAKFVGKLTVSTGDDVDFVVVSKIDTKAMSIDTGDGADVLALTDHLLAGGLTVKSGSGLDIVTLAQIVQSGTGANVIDTGADQDLVTLQVNSFSGATTLNLGGGTNTAIIDDVSFNSTFTLSSQGTSDVIAIEQGGGFVGATTFAKAARFNFGLGSLVAISNAGAATKTKFLSSVAFVGRGIPSTVAINVANTSFAIAPTVKNVLIV